MSNTTLWCLILSAAILVVCLILLHHLRSRKPKKPANDELQKVPQETAEPEPEEQETQQLLQQLQQLRSQAAQVQNRHNCAALFHKLSLGLQELFAQEKRPCDKDSVFCRRLNIVICNESIASKLEDRKPLRQPEPLSPEDKAADLQTLQHMLYVEEENCQSPDSGFHWDALMEAMIPCLEALICAVEEKRAEDCRQLLSKLRDVLRENQVVLLWHDDPAVQQDDDLLSCFLEAAAYPIPAFFQETETGFNHIGSRGCTGPNTEI